MKKEKKLAEFVAAVSNGHLDEAEELLGSGLDINAKIDGMSALHHAVQSRSLSGFKWLLEQGASLEGRDTLEMTPLMWACSLGGKKANQMAMLLLAKGCDVTFRRSDGMSAIEFAAGKASPEVLRALIKRGADLNGPDNAELFPALLAARSGNLESLKTLIELGCDMKKTTQLRWAKGMTCLEVARLDKRWSIVKYLEQHGIN